MIGKPELDLKLVLATEPILVQLPKGEFVDVRPFTVEQVARLYHIPYWFIEGRKPSWLRRPVWRMRAARWARETK